MNCSEINPNLEAYALGALDPYTRARVETHLQTCAACRHTLASFREVVGELPLVLSNISPLSPPPSLKQQIMQAAQLDMQAQEQAHAIQQTFAPRAERAAPVTRRVGWLLNPRVWMFALASSMVLIVLLLGLSLMSNVQMQQALSREQLALQQLGSLQANQQQAFALTASTTKQEIVLNATDAEPRAYGKVTLEPNKPTVLFTASNLSPPALDQRYFLWTVNKGTIQLVSQFAPNQDGFAMIVFMADRDDPVLKEVFVTRQSITKLLPSNERILSWKARPNDLSEEYSSTTAAPRPTIVRPTQ